MLDGGLVNALKIYLFCKLVNILNKIYFNIFKMKIFVIGVNNTPMNGGSRPKHWYKVCWEEYIKEINKMLLIE